MVELSGDEGGDVKDGEMSTMNGEDGVAEGGEGGQRRFGGVDIVDPALLAGGEEALRKNARETEEGAEAELLAERDALTASYIAKLKQAALTAVRGRSGGEGEEWRGLERRAGASFFFFSSFSVSCPILPAFQRSPCVVGCVRGTLPKHTARL